MVKEEGDRGEGEGGAGEGRGERERERERDSTVGGGRAARYPALP